MSRDRTMEPLRTALRQLLDEQEMTDTELMARADLSPATVSLYLSGKRGRRMNSQAIETVRRLAAALGVEPDYFLEYRIWRVQEIMRRCPELVDDVYDFLVNAARVGGIIDEAPQDSQ